MDTKNIKYSTEFSDGTKYKPYCPNCGRRHHNGGYIDYSHTYRCFGCGENFRRYHPDPNIDDEIQLNLYKEKHRSPTVEYCFLKLILNHKTNDNITVGVVHWDGYKLRTFWPTKYLGIVSELKSEKLFKGIEKIKNNLDSGFERLNWKKENTLKDIYSFRNIEDFPDLQWSEIVSEQTIHSEKHFDELKGLFYE